MRVFLAPEFLEDLKAALHPEFVHRVLDSLVDKTGQFKADRNDHRYTGIVDAWIRYASAGRTAFRVIYIRQHDSVFVYRAGFHSIEDHISAPQAGPQAIGITALDLEREGAPEFLDFGALLFTTKPTLLRHAIAQMFHVAHHEIVLVSPFLSETLLARHHFFGRFLDKAIEEETLVSVITRPSDGNALDFYRSLEERGISIYFHKTVHAKLYLFDVDPVNQGRRDSLLPRTAILGSANLTESGMCLAGDGGNEELCYRIPAYKFDEARDYINSLMRSASDFNAFKRSLRRF